MCSVGNQGPDIPKAWWCRLGYQELCRSLRCSLRCVLFGRFQFAVGRATVRADRVAVVAFFAKAFVDHAVTAARPQGAVLLAAVVAALVASVVALFAKQALNAAIAAIGTKHTTGGATGHFGEAIIAQVDAVVAGLGRVLDKGIAAARSRCAVRHAAAVGTVVDTVVAKLIAGHDAIAAGGCADALGAGETRQGKIEIRAGRPSFCVKQDDLVDVACDQAKGRRGGGVECELSADGGVHAAQIECQLSVDENPDVVIARKVQRFTAAEFKPSSNFRSEAVVVAICIGKFVAFGDLALVIEREEA